jgi:AcrR family transcriptional regulator
MELSRVEKSRQKILKAAYDIMCKKGVAQTSIMDVAKKSKTSHPHVTYHFADIDQLYVGVIHQILEEMRDETQAAMDRKHANSHQVLKAYCEVLFHWAKRNEEKLKLFVYFYYLASLDSKFTSLNNEIRKVGRERVETILAKGIAFGEFQKRSAAEVKALATFIQGIVTGNLIMAVSEDTLSLDEAAQITSKFVGQLTTARL